MSNSYRERVLQDHPTLYWPFDDTSGPSVSNIVDDTFDAVIWSSDYVRDISGPEQTGVRGTRIGAPNGVGVSGLPTEDSVLSATFWYREIGPRSAWTTLTHCIDWGAQGWALLRNDSTNHVYLYLETTAGRASVGFDASNNVLNGNWHHVALVLNNGTGSLYVDGRHIATGSFDPGDGLGHDSLNLVEWVDSNDASREVAEYSVWLGTALSAEQIQQHYTAAYGESDGASSNSGVPSGVSATATGGTQIEVTWQDVPGAQQYVLQRRLVSHEQQHLADSIVGAKEEHQPFASIQELIDRASSGDTVSVPAGIYRETITINKGITLVGEPGAEIRGSDDWSGDSWTEINGRFRSSRAAAQNNREGRDPFPGGHFPGGPDREEYCRVWVNGSKLAFVTADPGAGQFTLDGERRVILGSGIYPGNGATVEVAVRRRWIDIVANNVTVQGLTCQHAANGPFSGGVQSHQRNNVTLRECTFRHAHGLNVYLTGGDVRERNVRVINNEISHAGCIGIHAAGFKELEIRGNRIHHNNAAHFHRHWHAGGVKLYSVEGVDFTSNHLHNNNSVGVWFDGPCRNNRIHGNRVHDDYIGIYYEVSYSGEIFDNVVFHCSYSGIYLGNATDTVVRNNVVAWNGHGILIYVRDRSSEPYDVGPSAGTHRNVRVRDNNIFFSGGAGLGNTAAVAWEDAPPDWAFGPEHVGTDNRYWVEQTVGSDRPFRWRQHRYHDVSEFASTPAETTASYMSPNERDDVLIRHEIHMPGG